MSLFFILNFASPSLGRIELNIARVGFPTQTKGQVVRAGQWVPVVVDLALIDQQDFNGTLRIGQLDLDGDEPFDEIQVHLRAETGGANRYTLYALANPVGNHGRFVIELFDDQGDIVEVLSQGELTELASTPDNIGLLADDSDLILSLSTGALGEVRDLAGTEITNEYRNPLFISHMSPLDLPEHWIGLEVVDYIVWDDPQPEDLTQRQIDALVDWVRHGGTLLLAASRSAGLLKMSDQLYDLLPVDIGDLETVENLPDLRKDLLGEPQKEAVETEEFWWTTPYPKPVPVARCTARTGAVSLARDKSDATVTRKRVNRGHIVFSGVMLKDFFSGDGEPGPFFETVFHLMRLDDQEARPNPSSLFGQIVSAVGFATRGFSLLLLAGALSLVYVLVATLGTWQLTGRRGWRQHSWSAFGMVSLATSIMAIFSVGAIRGFGGESIHQVAIVDGNAGSSNAYATAYFGIKTGMDKMLDLWLPSDPIGATEPYSTDCFLRPLPVSANPMEYSGGFADPITYRLEPASAVVHDVRLRATLKRFEGRWQGRLPGTITGEVRIPSDRRTLILDGSYLINDLGVDLKGCYLLHAGLALELAFGPRGQSTYAYPVGEIPSNGEPLALAPFCHPPQDATNQTASYDQFRLIEAQKEWGSTFRSLFSGLAYGRTPEANVAVGQEKNALRLISTIGDYDPSLEQTPLGGAMGLSTYSRDRMRHLDLRDQLTRDSVMLIGFADDPGPMRLFRREGDRPYKGLEPDPQKSWTMYRIRIPVTIVENNEP